MCSYTMMCNCTTVYVNYDSIEAYDNEYNEVELNENRLPVYWKIVPKHENAESWEYKLVCERCKREVEFYSYMDDRC